MSWISSSGLSSLRSQLSDLTRDVIQETDADISSLESDYKLARSRLAELDILEESQKQEIQNLMLDNLNLQDRTEAAELQAATVSKEFRNVIVSMQEELKGVKQENKSLKEYLKEHTVAAENSNTELVTQQELENQISKLQEELLRQTEQHREQIISLQQHDAVNIPDSTQLHKSIEISMRGEGDGIDYNGAVSHDSTMDTELEKNSGDNTNINSSSSSREIECRERLEVALAKERAHKERLLAHLEEISNNHDMELISLLEKNASLNKEIEDLKRDTNPCLGKLNTDRTFSTVSTQTLPLAAKERGAAIQSEGIGWLQDEVKSLSVQLCASSLQVQSLTRERDTKQKVLENLQLTVRQLERESDSLRCQSVATWREQVQTYQQQVERLSREVSELEEKCQLLEREQSQQLTANDVYTAVTAGGRKLTGPHEYLEAELLRVKAELYRSVLERNNMVNRDQTRSLLLQYVRSPPPGRAATLQSLSELLAMSREDIDIISRIVLNTSVATTAPPVKSFTQLFVEFLMQESNPQQSHNSTHQIVKKDTAIEPLIETRSTTRDRDERPSLSTVSLVPTNFTQQLTSPLPQL